MQITELAAKVQALGLTDKEAKVYVAALFLGPSSVQKIAEQAEINRPTAYVVLDQLAEYGLVSQSTEGKKTVYVAEGPDAVERWLEAQEQAVRTKRQELKNLAGELRQNERDASADAPMVRFFKGEAGAKSIQGYLRRKARPKSTIYAMSNIDELVRIVPDVLTQNPEARLKKQLSSKLIYSYEAGEWSSSHKYLRETKKIDEPVQADINLYENGITISTYEGKESIGIVVESAKVAAALRQLFDLAWRNLDK